MSLLRKAIHLGSSISTWNLFIVLKVSSKRKLDLGGPTDRLWRAYYIYFKAYVTSKSNLLALTFAGTASSCFICYLTCSNEGAWIAKGSTANEGLSGFIGQGCFYYGLGGVGWGGGGKCLSLKTGLFCSSIFSLSKMFFWLLGECLSLSYLAAIGWELKQGNLLLYCLLALGGETLCFSYSTFLQSSPPLSFPLRYLLVYSFYLCGLLLLKLVFPSVFLRLLDLLLDGLLLRCLYSLQSLQSLSSPLPLFQKCCSRSLYLGSFYQWRLYLSLRGYQSAFSLYLLSPWSLLLQPISWYLLLSSFLPSKYLFSSLCWGCWWYLDLWGWSRGGVLERDLRWYLYYLSLLSLSQGLRSLQWSRCELELLERRLQRLPLYQLCICGDYGGDNINSIIKYAQLYLISTQTLNLQPNLQKSPPFPCLHSSAFGNNCFQCCFGRLSREARKVDGQKQVRKVTSELRQQIYFSRVDKDSSCQGQRSYYHTSNNPIILLPIRMKTLLIIVGLALVASSYKSTTEQGITTMEPPFPQTPNAPTHGNDNNGDHTRKGENHRGRHELSERQIEEAIMVGMCAAVVISCLVGIVLCYKCSQRRRIAEGVKNSMKAKRLLYASSLGISCYELNNDPRLSYTMHV